MSAYYTPIESEWLKAERMAREPGINLVKCEDGIWRTPQEKTSWDEAAGAQKRIA